MCGLQRHGSAYSDVDRAACGRARHADMTPAREAQLGVQGARTTLTPAPRAVGRIVRRMSLAGFRTKYWTQACQMGLDAKRVRRPWWGLGAQTARVGSCMGAGWGWWEPPAVKYASSRRVHVVALVGGRFKSSVRGYVESQPTGRGALPATLPVF